MKKKIIIYGFAQIAMFLTRMILRNIFPNEESEILGLIYLVSLIAINSIVTYYLINVKNWIRIIISVSVVCLSLVVVYLSTEIEYLNNIYRESNNVVPLAFISCLMIMFQELSLKILKNYNSREKTIS
jgi:hypothetical protein